jgi:PAS domain S-box-containing protein
MPTDEGPAVVSLRTGQPVRNLILGIRRTPGCETLWVLVNAMPLPAGQVRDSAAVVITFADVTAQRQAMAVVRASEEKYRGLIESLPLMLIQTDRDGRIEYVNPATEVISGYRLEDVREPAAWQAMLHPEDLPKVFAALAQAQVGRTVRVEARYRAKDGGDRVAYLIVQPRWHGGEIVGATILAVDMTRERRLEHELQRAQRLELIGRLSSGIAHDFNNLLNVILNLTELAQTHLAPDHPVAADLKRIAETGEQAAGLAGQLLAFGKQRTLTPRPVDVNRVAARTLELLRGTLPGSITIEPCLAGGELCVQADQMQLHQVLMNLCLNARDAMPQGGRLTLQTEEIDTHNGNGHAGWVRVAVQDTGQGMSEAVRARIFDPFFSTKEHGTGLGLAVVQQIIQGHGGEIKVWSQPGQGSRFEIWLPRRKDEG